MFNKIRKKIRQIFNLQRIETLQENTNIEIIRIFDDSDITFKTIKIKGIS